MKLQIGILDDNASVISLIKGTIKNGFLKYNIDTHIETFSSSDKMTSRLKEIKYNIVFLDIKMPDVDGVEYSKFVKQDNPDCEIVFISSREERVFDTFKVQPFGFVRKSNFLNDISEVLDRYVSEITKKEKVSNSITLSTHGTKKIYTVSNIIYFEGCGVYQLLHLKDSNQVIEVSSRMDSLQQSLQEYGFIRIHKGFLVNYYYIESFEGSAVVLQNSDRLPISRRKIGIIKKEYMEVCKKFNVLIF